MRHVDFRGLGRGFAARSALAIAAVALLAAGAAVLAGQQAQAQTGTNTNPKVHQTPLRNGAAVTEYVIDELGGTSLTHVELRLGSGSNGETPATYQDYGRVELWLSERPGPNLHDTSSSRRWYYSSTSGTPRRLALCDGGASNRCQLQKDEWKTLAGQSGVTSQQEATTEIKPIRLAFNVPDTITAGTIQFGVVHYVQAATRPGSSTQWGPGADWTVLTYGVNAIPVDDQDRPLWVRNSLTDSTERRSYQYPFAAGHLTHVRLNPGLATALGDSRDTITYAQFSSVSLTLEDSADRTTFNSDGGEHRNLFTTTAGANLAACGTSGNACVIDKAEWKALAGQSGVTAQREAATVVKPIRIAIKVPRQFPSGTDYDGASVKLATEMSGSGVRIGDREATFKRLSAHISRMQTAKFEMDNGRRVRTAVEPNANDNVADGDHTVKECAADNLQAGGSPMTDCYRAVEVGERIYLENILRVGGAADNTGASTPTTRTSDEWLRVDSARHGVFFDRIEVSASVGGTAGGGIVAIGTLCPVAGPVEPAHPSGSANVPRDRTAAALAKCVYNRSGTSGTYWGGTGPRFIPVVSTGTVTVTVSYHKGNDDPGTATVDESLVAEDSLDIPVAAATDNTDTGNGGSSWDESDLIAELGQRSYDDSLGLLIGHRRNRGIPEFWGGTSSPTGPGTITGATYASVDATEAVTLTVPAGGGTIELLGASKSCTASSSACTLTITRSDLKTSARYGVPANRRGAAIADSAAYWPARLLFEHASPPRDVTISGVLKRADGTTHSFSYEAGAAEVRHGAVVAAYLPEDADSVLAPSQTTALAVGYNVPGPSSDGGWRAFNPTPEFYEGKSYTGDILSIGLMGAPARLLPASVRGSYLQLTGPATWTETGGRRLRLDRTGYTYYKCVAASSLAGGDAEGRICYISDADGNAPSITADSDAAADLAVTASLPIWTLSGESEPVAPTAGGNLSRFFRAGNTHQSQRLEAFGRATLRVASIAQLASISLSRPAGASGPVRSGGPAADLLIGLLNENGGASQLGSVSAVTLTVIGGGNLSSTYGCSLAAASCSLDLSENGTLASDIKSSDAGKGPGLLSKVPFRFQPGTRPAEVTIRATVVGADGSTYSETLELVVSGSAASISINGDVPRLLAYDTADDDPATAGVNEGEDRDLARVPVTARDANGAKARMPTGARVTISGPTGGALPAGSIAAEVSCSDDERTKCHVVINVNAARTSPLASGSYTASVSAAGSPVSVPFTIAGDAETLVITAPGELGGLGQSFSASVRAVDANGVPVADGTWVTFRATPASSRTVTTAITSPGEEEVDHDGDPDTPAMRLRRARTMNGVAMANLTVVGNGITVLTASIGDKSASKPLDTRTATVPAGASRTGLILEYSGGQAATGTWATYRGSSTTSADALLGHAEAPADARIVWFWNGVEWIRYGEADGRPLPGSRAFVVLPGDTVWFGE